MLRGAQGEDTPTVARKGDQNVKPAVIIERSLSHI